MALTILGEEEEENTLPPVSTIYQLLDGLIHFDSSSDMLPLAQYVRSRVKAGIESPPTLQPNLSALLKIRPNTVQDVLAAMLKSYMDEHPDEFFRVEVL